MGGIVVEALQVFLQGFVPDSNRVTIRSVAISKTDFFIFELFLENKK